MNPNSPFAPRVWRLFVIALVLTAMTVVVSGDVHGQSESGERRSIPQQDSHAVIPGQYIVVFKKGVSNPAAMAGRLTRQHGGSLRFSYEHTVKGFAARLPAQAANALRQNPNVAYVEPDRPVQLFDVQQDPQNWGLDRIDQANLPLDQSFTYGNEASGVNIYIIDSGVRRNHHDFGGRVEYVPSDDNGDFVGDGHGSAEDCFGHGTHVAGVAASATHGVAKGATIWAARVTDCAGFGDASMAVAAVDWITGNGLQPAVVNMSLGYVGAQSLHDAVESSIAAGFVYVVAAGNQIVPADACIVTPANVAGALTVGATEIDDDEAFFSNYGSCVDILAPGVDIVSTWSSGNDAVQRRSGTSVAAPHVAGAAALYLCANPSATPAQVASAVTINATPGRINLHSLSQGVTPNLLLYVPFIGACGEAPANNAPMVANAIPDTAVSAGNAPIDNYRDLNTVFSDTEDGGALMFAIASNSDPGLVTVAIDADSALDLSFIPDQSGDATLVVRATDSGGLSVDDTVVVTVTPIVPPVNDPPVVVNAVPDTSVIAGSAPIDNYRDLNTVFTDTEDGGALMFAIASNSNPGLVTVAVDADSALDLSFTPNQIGDATLVVRATDSGGLSVDDTVVVTVTPIVPPVNDPPVVANAVPDTSVTAGSAPIDNYRDLNTVFTDAEEGGVLMFAIDSNSNPGLVSVVIDADSALDLSFTPNQSGDATLVVRATDSGGLSVDDTFVVTVTSITPPANNPPTVTNAIPDTTITIGAAIDSYRDLHAVFGDAEDEGALVFSVESNSNPESVRGSIKGRNELVLRAKRKTGRATIVIRASDSGALTVCDTVVVTVIAVNDPPTVASAIQDTTVTEGDPPIDNYRDLNDVFVDTEDGGALAFSIESNTNPALVTTVIDADSALDLSFTPDQNGDATIVIRATDSGALWTEDTFVVTVTAVAVLPPATITGLPELATPKRSALYQNLPNPFNPTTTIGFDVARTGKVVLRIYDANGRLVRTIVNSELPQARHEIEWDGRDDGGNTVASGVYFYRLVTRDFRATKKLVLLK